MNNETEIKQDLNDTSPNTIYTECNITQKDVYALGDINIKEEPIEYEHAEQKIPAEEITFVQNIDSKPDFLEIEDSKVTYNLDRQNVVDDFQSSTDPQLKSEKDQMDCIPLETEVFDKEDVHNKSIYNCLECSFKFDSKLTYMLHLKTQHIVNTDKKLFKCSLCGRESKYKSSIKRHMMNKHRIDKIYKCQQCTYETICMIAIERHVVAVHGDANKTNSIKRYRRTMENMFKCYLCKYESKCRSNMRRHVKCKHKDNKCPQCIYETDCKNELKEHLTTHGMSKNTDRKGFIRTPQNLYKCKLCKYESRYRFTIYGHVLSKHDKTSDKKHKCSQCDYETYEINLMEQHVLNHDIRPYECEVCNKSFRRTNDLKNHSWTHSGEKRFKCSYCDYKNNHKFSIKIHVRNKHIELKNKDYKCTQCPYETNFKPHLNRHVKRHLLGGDKEFKCMQCSYNTNFKSNLKLHMQNKHEEVRKYKCKLCKYETNCKTKMKQHIMNHENIKLYKCNICNKLFKRSDSLKKHTFIHLEERKFQCAHCDYKTNYKLSLVVHVNSKHVVAQDKKYKCAKCNYDSDSHLGYKRHIRKHLMNNDKIFKCSQCTYRSNVRAFLKRHYFHGHNDVKSFECYICSKRFREKSQLRRHIQDMHISEKKYNCKECNYKTNIKIIFTGHILTHHSR